MYSLKDKETPLKDVEKLARIAGDEVCDGAKKHIKKNHIFPVKQGKSYFLSSEEASIWKLVEEACNRPDSVKQHRSGVNKYVLKKKFSAPAGIHGKTASLCLCLPVIYNIREQRVVTAFPTM